VVAMVADSQEKYPIVSSRKEIDIKYNSTKENSKNKQEKQ